MKSIVLPAGTEHVQFGDLAHLIAFALHPFSDNATDLEMMAYGGALINLDAELLQAVKVGSLPVKDPLTLGPHTFPVGDALRRSRVVVDDLRQFVAGRLSVEIAQTAAPAPVVAESPEQRRARWLEWYGKGERGAVQAVYERELKLNPKADRSFIGKQIKVAHQEKANAQRGGAWTSQLVQDGKRKG